MTVDGKDYVLEKPLRGDFALIKAYKADPRGNLIYRKTARNFNPIMAMASDFTIVEVQEDVPIDTLDPEVIVTPGVFVDTYGTSKVDFTDGEIAAKVKELYDLRPGLIEQNLKLRQPMYSESAAYGHMGRTNETVTKTFKSADGKTELSLDVELFTWEKLDFVEAFKKAFNG